MSDDGLEDLLASPSGHEARFLSQCFLGTGRRWGGRAAKLLNRTWKVVYDWHDSTAPGRTHTLP